MGLLRRERPEIKTGEQIALMRRSGLLLSRVHDMLAAHIRPGITTGELDRLAEEMIRDEGALPNFKGYQGYPATVCISVNEVIVHGIPGSELLEEGDILTVDAGMVLDGFAGDAAVTFTIGPATKAQQALIDART